MLKKIVSVIIVFIGIFGATCWAEPKAKCSVEEGPFVQYYATGNWTNPGIYRVEARITKHIKANGDFKYWLHVNARGRADGFTTKAMILVGDKEYPLKCVDVISSEYRYSMSEKSRDCATELQEFYDINPMVMDAIYLTTKPVCVVVNFKKRPNVRLKAEDSFFGSVERNLWIKIF